MENEDIIFHGYHDHHLFRVFCRKVFCDTVSPYVFFLDSLFFIEKLFTITSIVRPPLHEQWIYCGKRTFQKEEKGFK